MCVCVCECARHLLCWWLVSGPPSNCPVPYCLAYETQNILGQLPRNTNSTNIQPHYNFATQTILMCTRQGRCVSRDADAMRLRTSLATTPAAAIVVVVVAAARGSRRRRRLHWPPGCSDHSRPTCMALPLMKPLCMRSPPHMGGTHITRRFVAQRCGVLAVV